jgi:hypothetical protein
MLLAIISALSFPFPSSTSRTLQCHPQNPASVIQSSGALHQVFFWGEGEFSSDLLRFCKQLSQRILLSNCAVYRSRYSYWLDGRSSNPGKGKIFLFSTTSGRLWAPPNLLYKGCGGWFFWGQGWWGVKLTTHLRLMPRSRMVELYLLSPCIFMA